MLLFFFLQKLIRTKCLLYSIFDSSHQLITSMLMTLKSLPEAQISSELQSNKPKCPTSLKSYCPLKFTTPPAGTESSCRKGTCVYCFLLTLVLGTESEPTGKWWIDLFNEVTSLYPHPNRAAPSVPPFLRNHSDNQGASSQ